MGRIENFYDLDAWEKSHILVLEIYKMTKLMPDSERFGMISQMRRAASSVTANIAEGFARFHFRDKIRFYYHARGSIAEIQNFLILAKDLGYISYEACGRLGKKATQTAKLVNGLIRATEKQQAKY